ncbi:MAG: DUF6890 family protein [Desulfovibrio sp.]|uniref:DUF6890 family protein n=1 Tax=Desulfovibrio sp. 7SRBS1 TaxID=3378064 RepID=UPI003B4166FD
MRDNALAQIEALSRKWFSDRQPTRQSRAQALFLETDYWEKMETAVCNALVRAFGG